MRLVDCKSKRVYARHLNKGHWYQRATVQELNSQFYFSISTLWNKEATSALVYHSQKVTSWINLVVVTKTNLLLAWLAPVKTEQSHSGFDAHNASDNVNFLIFKLKLRNKMNIFKLGLVRPISCGNISMWPTGEGQWYKTPPRSDQQQIITWWIHRMKITWTTLMVLPSQLESRRTGERLGILCTSFSKTPTAFEV